MDPDLLALCRLLANRPAELKRLLLAVVPGEALLQERNLVDDDLKRQIELDQQWLSQDSHHLILFTDADYPSCLNEIHSPPCFLFAAGDRSVLELHPEKIAMVGSRKASRYGLRQAMQMAEYLARHSILVVSGLAMGIDAAAHEGALAAGAPTVAVLGTGCDEIYPKRNWRLAGRIQETGLLVSEFPLRTLARPAHFPRRNRIVTGMTRATLVIEAALQSGSLISAKLALAEGRDVMAMPGPVTNREARGCHQLIREGAVLIESGQDVLVELGMGDTAMPSLAMNNPGVTGEQKLVLECLAQGPVSVDLMMVQLDMSVEDLMIQLVTLEVLGLIHSEAGRYELCDGV